MTELATLFQIAVAATLVAAPMIVLVRLIAGNVTPYEFDAPARGVQEGEPVRFAAVAPFARLLAH